MYLFGPCSFFPAVGCTLNNDDTSRLDFMANCTCKKSALLSGKPLAGPPNGKAFGERWVPLKPFKKESFFEGSLAGSGRSGLKGAKSSKSGPN